MDELFDSVDVEAEIEDKLPEDLESLSGPATAGLREGSYQLVARALERPRLQRLWALSVEQTHETLVRVLESEEGTVSTEGGVVTLDLELIVLEAADRIGLRSEVEDQLPADVGTIEILRSDELDTAQDSFQLLKTLAWVLPLLALVAFAVGAWVSGDRVRALRRIGITFLVVGVVGIVAANVVGAYVVGSLVSETQNEDAAGNAWDILSELLRTSYRWLVVGGILFLVAAWLAGPGRRAVAARRVLAPALRARLWAYAALVLLALVLLFTGPAGDFARYLFVLAFFGLGVAWIELMRTQALREFPDASAPSSSPTPGLASPAGGRRRRAGRRRARTGAGLGRHRLASGGPRRPARPRRADRRGVRLGERPERSREGRPPGRRTTRNGLVQPGGGGPRPRGHVALRRGRGALRALLRVLSLRATPGGARPVGRGAPANDVQLPPADRDGAYRAHRRLERPLRLPHDAGGRSAFLASGAVLAIIAGVALSTPLGNLGSGVLLAFTQPVRLGDRVTVGDHTGVVERISLSYTALVTDEGPHVFVPNQMMVSTTLVNRTRGAP